MEKHTAQCPEVQENLSAFVDGEVTKSERTLVETHLTECGVCRDKLSETMRLIGAVAALPRVEAGPGYLRALKARMQEPESLADRLLEMLTGRGATAGLGFALGAAACFMLVVGNQAPAPAPAADGTVEVALSRPAPSAPVAPAPTMTLANLTPSANTAGAPVPAAPVVVAPVPAKSLAALPPLPAPPVLAPGPRRPALPSDRELETIRLDLGTTTTVASRPSTSRAVAPMTGSGLPSETVAARPTEPSRTQPFPADVGRVPAAPEPVAEPATRVAELAGALPAGTPLLEGADAEKAQPGDFGHQLQVIVTRPAAFLAELSVVVNKTAGLRLNRVLILDQPALQVELTGDTAAALDTLKDELNHLRSVKAVAATTTEKSASRAAILISLSTPIAR